MPRIPDQYLDCVFYLYSSEEDAQAGRNEGGTGFFVSINTKTDPSQHFIFAVTNWHVACRDGASVIRVMRKDGTPETFGLGPEDWSFDPDGHDVAIAVVPVSTAVHSVAYVPLDDHAITLMADLPPLGVGDDVFMIGRFVDHDGGEINKPTVRFGNISLMLTPIEQPNGNKREAYCLDMHSRSYSGSPVFVFRTPGWDLSSIGDGTEGHVLTKGARVLLPLGIHVGQFPEIWKIKGAKVTASPADSADLQSTEQHIQGVSGMTVVAPISAIRKLLDLPKMKERMAKAEERLAKERAAGVVPEPEP